jgi:outer membrane lipoprotein LolB
LITTSVRPVVARPRVLLLGLLSGVALMAGCATRPVTPTAPATAGRSADPAELSQWTAKGRLSLAAAGEGGIGSFVWQQRSERTELSVRGPLGAGGLHVVTDGERLELLDDAGRTLDGEAARLELEQRLGTRLPLDALRYWMLGVPAPHDDGAWTVSFDEYRPVQGWSLPRKVTAQTGDTRVRIVIDHWQLPTP